MENNLSEEEKLRLAEEEKNKVVVTDEVFEAEFEKRMGAKPTEFVKKAEVLTAEQQKEIDDKRNADALSYALSNNIISPVELESYNKIKGGNLVDLARQKFIDYYPEDKDAGELFDKMIRLGEPDEFEDGETKKPNEEKRRFVDFALKIAQEELDKKLGNKINSVPGVYQKHLEAKALIQNNEAMISKVVSELPTRLEMEVEIEEGVTEKVGIDLQKEDIEAAQKMLLGESGRKGLKAEDLKLNAGAFLATKNIQRLLNEAALVAYKKGADSVERGDSGLNNDGNKNVRGVSKKRQALINSGVIKA